jgi:hypothetical protein
VTKFKDGLVDSLVVEMEFQVHSELYDLLNTGIELDLILADGNDYEQQNRLSNVQKKLKEGEKHIKKGINTQ